MGKVKRWSAEKEKIDVQQPHVFKSYNGGMGGVNLHDQAVNNYMISIRGKWWGVLFIHMLKVTKVHAWKLHVLAIPTKMDRLTFTRNIVQHYIFSCTKK